MESAHIPLPHTYIKIRRLMEVTLILLSSPLILLLFIIIALLVKLDSRGSIIFKQIRLGLNNKYFTMYKFRSMLNNSVENFLTQENDLRLTKVGGFIRKYKLDEIPQFWNVLKNDMSLIGPRPVPFNFIAAYKGEICNYANRHMIKPGITGLAQVMIGYTNSMDGEKLKFRYDLEYIQNMGLSIDFFIIITTVKTLIKPKGIMPEEVIKFQIRPSFKNMSRNTIAKIMEQKYEAVENND